MCGEAKVYYCTLVYCETFSFGTPSYHDVF